MRTIAPTRPDPDTQPFWDAARKGRFLLRICRDCDEAHWFPRSLCPFCWSARTEWVPGSGLGRIYSWTVLRRVAEPYAIGYVTLDEGPRMLTNIIDCDLEQLAIGQRVGVVFVPTSDSDGPPVPMFRPVPDTAPE